MADTSLSAKIARPSLDTWSVLVALLLAAFVRLGLIKTVPW